MLGGVEHAANHAKGRSGARQRRPYWETAPIGEGKALPAAQHVSPEMGKALDKTEHRRTLKRASNTRYREKHRAEVARLKAQVASLMDTLKRVSGILATAHRP